MQIIPLSEGTFTVDATKVFVPFDAGHDELQTRPRGSLLVEIQPFVIITSKDVLLLDTGLGFHKDGSLQLHQNLESNGIHPSRVTKVLLTHLHKDHAGGISSETVDDHTRRLNFVNAKFFVQRRELSFAFEKGSSSFRPEELEVLKQSSQLVLLDDDKGDIENYIFYEVTSAHSRYHQVFRIEEQQSTIFFGGDDAPQLQQMKHRFIAKYDFNGKRAMEMRKLWWEVGQNEKWTFLFYHDVKNAVWKF
jgi:glyoxylase-like metal-dependent hydrolase (beta-lactamase superfamily II)